MKLTESPYFVVTLVFGLAGLGLSGCAASFWANGDTYMGWGYQMGDNLWMMGFPLTGWLLLFNGVLPAIEKSDDLWVVPLATVCMTVQWIAWGWLLVWLGVRLTRKKNGDNPTTPPTVPLPAPGAGGVR
jgi:hypothetical protein